MLTLILLNLPPPCSSFWNGSGNKNSSTPQAVRNVRRWQPYPVTRLCVWGGGNHTQLQGSRTLLQGYVFEEVAVILNYKAAVPCYKAMCLRRWQSYPVTRLCVWGGGSHTQLQGYIYEEMTVVFDIRNRGKPQ